MNPCKYCGLSFESRIDRRLHIQFHLEKMDALDIVEEFYTEDKK